MTSALTTNGVQTVKLKNTILSPACQAGVWPCCLGLKSEQFRVEK
jgi:hypothetical protein